MRTLNGWPFEPLGNPWIDPCGEDDGPGAGPGNPH